MSWRVSDAAANLFTGQAYVGSNVSFGAASVIGGFDSGSSFAPPASLLKLATFIGIQLTSSSGHRAGFASWWTHSKVFATSNGTSTGTVRASRQPAERRNLVPGELLAVTGPKGGARPGIPRPGTGTLLTEWCRKLS